MNRAKRFEPVREIAQNAERSCAARVAGMERRLAEAQHREQELRRYRQEYQTSFEARAKAGLDIRSLREYQGFLARLGVAITAQQQLLEQLRADCERERGELRAAVTRRQALGKVIERVHVEQRRVDDRRAQHDLDERAQRQPRVQS
jgi:flagellar FliJ protein